MTLGTPASLPARRRISITHGFGVLVLTLTVLLLAPGCGGEKAPQAAKTETEPAAKESRTVEERAPSPPAIAWPLYHGGSSLDGWADIELPETLVLRWKTELGAAIATTPVAGDGRIYAADAKGGIHAVDMSGGMIWSRVFAPIPRAKGPALEVTFDAPIALAGATLIACSSAGTIYALDPATGATRWESALDIPILGTPSFATVDTDSGPQPRLFVIDQSEGALLALDLGTGKPIWTSKGVSRCDGSAAVNAEMAVFGSCAGVLHVFSTQTGGLLREIPIDDDSQVAAGPVLIGDSVYSPSRSGKFIHANVRTGETLWTNTDCDDEAYSTPAVHENWVVFTANNGKAYALDRATGQLRWRTDLGGTPSSPVMTRDKVAVTARGKLHILRLTDGQKLWSYEVGDESTGPALYGGLVIVGTDEGFLMAFGPQQGA